ncbi:MAG: condensation domain-containing protein, partial [Thermoanaerobaculia bacterium]
AWDHQELPFNALVEAVRPERDLSRNPLFQVMFAYLNLPSLPRQLAGLSWEPVVADTLTTVFDISFFVHETPEGLGGVTRFSTELYEPRSMERLRHGFETAVGQVIATPDVRLSQLAAALTAADRRWREQEATRLQETAAHKLRQRRHKKRRGTDIGTAKTGDRP